MPALADLASLMLGAGRRQKVEELLARLDDLPPQGPALAAKLRGVDLAELCITSAATVRAGTPPESAFALPDVPGIGVVVGPAAGERCERCWRVLPEVGHVAGHDELCQRCAEVIDRGALPVVAAAK